VGCGSFRGVLPYFKIISSVWGNITEPEARKSQDSNWELANGMAKAVNKNHAYI